MHRTKPFFVPPEGLPQLPRLDPEIYTIMGESNIVQMMEDFYQEIGRSLIRHLFPEDLVLASRKTADFFVFLLGGPPLYQQKHGPPMMRKRHLPFEIDEEARREWLRCFAKTLEVAEEKYKFPLEHIPSFYVFLEKFSGWMVNTKKNENQ